MINESNHNLEERVANTELCTQALRKAQDAAIRLHRAYNVPMISWQDGKVVELSPFDLQTEDEKQQISSSID